MTSDYNSAGKYFVWLWRGKQNDFVCFCFCFGKGLAAAGVGTCLARNVFMDWRIKTDQLKECDGNKHRSEGSRR